MLIDSITIYDASFDYAAFVYSNQTDSGLTVTFNYQNLLLYSNKTFSTSGITSQINFELKSPGNSTGYYTFSYVYCCWITFGQGKDSQTITTTSLSLAIIISTLLLITKRRNH
ncbi:MAG: hypothetical protein ACW981_11925 [Candidatus Hodarchaeales archaeon]